MSLFKDLLHASRNMLGFKIRISFAFLLVLQLPASSTTYGIRLSTTKRKAAVSASVVSSDQKTSSGVDEKQAAISKSREGPCSPCCNSAEDLMAFKEQLPDLDTSELSESAEIEIHIDEDDQDATTKVERKVEGDVEKNFLSEGKEDVAKEMESRGREAAGVANTNAGGATGEDEDQTQEEGSDSSTAKKKERGSCASGLLGRCFGKNRNKY